MRPGTSVTYNTCCESLLKTDCTGAPTSEVSYFLVTSEVSCETAGGSEIGGESECEAAAAAIGIDLSGATVHTGADWAPSGCSYERETNEFYKAGTGEEEESVCGNQFECLCAGL